MKAQSSAEFLIIYAMMIAIFLGVFTIYASGSLNLFQSQGSVATMRNAYAVAAVLNYVYLAGDGAAYNFTMSGVEKGENITISDYEVESRRLQSSNVAPLLDGDVNLTTLVAGRGGNNMITNNRGELDIGG